MILNVSFKRLPCIALIAISLTWSCQSRNFQKNATSQHFIEQELDPEGATTSVGRLPLAGAFAKLGPNQIEAYRATPYGNDNPLTEIRLKDLTRVQVVSLRTHYAPLWGGKIPRAMQKVQDGDALLIDFLPPLIQATRGTVFEETSENTEQIRAAAAAVGRSFPPEMRTHSNCWGTVWEFLRLAREPVMDPQGSGDLLSTMSVFHAPHTILDTLRLPTHSRLVSTAPSPGVLQAIAKTSFDAGKGLRPGDALFIISTDDGQEVLEHAAIVLDEGLYFEKVGRDARAMYRVSYIEDILKMYGDIPGRTLKLEWRRFDASPLPHPVSAFATNKDAKAHNEPPQWTKTGRTGGQFATQMLDVQIVFDAPSGRARLHENAYSKGFAIFDKECGKMCLKCTIDIAGAQFQVPRFSAQKKTIALIPREGTEGQTPFKGVPQEGILLNRTQDNIWEGKVPAGPVRLEFFPRGHEVTLSWPGLNPTPKSVCSFTL